MSKIQAKDVMVNYHSTILQGFEKDTLTYQVKGKLLQYEDYSILNYIERLNEQDIDVQVCIKYSSQEVIIVREGTDYREYNFLKNKKSYALFDIDQFHLRFEIKLYEFNISDYLIEIDCEVYENDESIGDTYIKIEILDKEKC